MEQLANGQQEVNVSSQVQTNFNHPQVMKTIKYSWFNDHFAMLQLSDDVDDGGGRQIPENKKEKRKNGKK